MNNGDGGATGITLDVAGSGIVGTWNLANYGQTSHGAVVFDFNGYTPNTFDHIDRIGIVSPGGYAGPGD